VKISDQLKTNEFQAECVVTPAEKVATIQQLGAVIAQPNKAGLIQHLDAISTLLKKDAAKTQHKAGTVETLRQIEGKAESPTQINLAMVTN